MSYDLNQAKRELIALTRVARLERPYIMGYCREDEMSVLYKEMAQCLTIAHKKHIQLHFDTLTLAYLHLVDDRVLPFVLLTGFKSAFVKRWEGEETKREIPLHLSYVIKRFGPGDVLPPRENIDNVTQYDNLVNKARVFYLCMLQETDNPFYYGYVIPEKLTLEELEAPYIQYHETINDLKTRIDRFITENALYETLGDDFLKTRKAVLFKWLEDRFRICHQIIVFDDQTTYTMHQLLTNTAYENASHHLFVAMMGKVAFLYGTITRKMTFSVACHEYRHDDTSLREYMRQQPNILSNTPDLNTPISDVAVVKDSSNLIVSIRFLDKSPTNKLDTQRRFDTRCKEKIDSERRVLHADSKSLIETSREILIPYLDEMRHFFEPEHGEIAICGEVTSFLLQRMREIADRESGLDGASRTMKGCISHTMNKAKEALMNNNTQDNRGLTLTRSMIQLDEFTQQDVSSFAARDLIRDNENRRVLQHHYEQQTDVSTLNVMRGQEALSSTIVPCMIKNCYNTYVTTNNNNNTLIINQYDTSETKKRIEAYEKIIDQLVEEDDTEVRRAIKAGLHQTHPPIVTKKRKRITKEQPNDQRKRLMTKREIQNTVDNTTTTAMIVVRNTRTDTPDLTSLRECDYCEIKKSLGSFYHTKKTGQKTYGYIRNVCHTCNTTAKCIK